MCIWTDRFHVAMLIGRILKHCRHVNTQVNEYGNVCMWVSRWMNVHTHSHEKFINECEALCEVRAGATEIHDFEEKKVALARSAPSSMNPRFEWWPSMNLLRALVLLWRIKRRAHWLVRWRCMVALGLMPNVPTSCDTAATQTANAKVTEK